MNVLTLVIILCNINPIFGLISRSLKNSFKTPFLCKVRSFQITQSVFRFKASNLNSYLVNNGLVSLDSEPHRNDGNLKGSEIFSDSSFEATGINPISFQQWEHSLSNLLETVKEAKTKDNIIVIYKYLLALVCKKELDPLQITAFEVAVKTCAETLMKLHPIDSPITSLIDEITDIHLNSIEEMLSNKGTLEEENEDL